MSRYQHIHASGRTGNLTRRPSSPPTTTTAVRLVSFWAILDVMILAAACSADVAFLWFPPSCISYCVLHRTISHEVARLFAHETTTLSEHSRYERTSLQILQIYPSLGFARSGQSLIKC